MKKGGWEGFIKIKILVVTFLFCLSGFLGFVFYLILHPVNPEKVEVIRTFHYPALFAKQLKGDPDAGRKIFKEFCAACHAEQPVIDVHAPHIHDKKVWDSLGKLGMPILLKITTQGIGAMPARGGCFECSDAQLQEAIEYMLKGSITSF